jgi:hypothetical protein
MSTSKPPVPDRRANFKYPCFVGFYATREQRQKLDTLVKESHRTLGETMRMLLDHARLTVVDIDLTPAQITPKDAA